MAMKGVISALATALASQLPSSPLEIPPGTPPGHLFRLKGEGIERLGGRGRGDQIVEVVLRVPRPGELDDEQRELLRKLGELEGRPAREERGVLERVKDLFT